MSGMNKDVILAFFASHGIPRPEPEFRFSSLRRWRFDWAWPDPKHMLALEVEGGIWTGGRHTRGAGFLKDMDKYNAATVLGWRLLRCTPKQLESGETMKLVRLALQLEPA